ncbi:MAG TPA: S16 family serine protease, partial [Paracoccaceae bacterium]|nr:S16 family serine protease [Paracoccaceae bacterium]
LAKTCRKVLTEIVRGDYKSVAVTKDNLEHYLGVRRFKHGLAEETDQVGVTTGLAYTSVGGDLMHIEALKLPGRGRMKTTGTLGDVMKESIDAAASFVRSKAAAYGIKPTRFEKMDIHVHVPEGATPKDGPSAGIAMVTSIVSVLTDIPVRRDVAMTGEVTLRGNVLPIGGLKEKLLAALRGGIKTVLIPKDNVKDLADIPDNVKDGLELIPVENVSQVLAHVLVRQPEPIEWDEAEELEAPRPKDDDGDAAASSLAH